MNLVKSTVLAAAFLAFLSASVLAEEKIDKLGFQPGKPRKGWDFSEMGKIPILNGGRVKPLDSYAREGILFLTSSSRLRGWNSLDAFLSILSFPQQWKGREIFKVVNPELKKQLLFDARKSKYSYQHLATNSVFLQYAEVGIGRRETTKQSNRPSLREKELNRLVHGFLLFRAMVDGNAWGIIPANSPEPWTSMGMASAKEGNSDPLDLKIQSSFKKMVQAYYKGDEKKFFVASQETRAAVEDAMIARNYGGVGQVRAEAFYNRLAPIRLAWIFYLMASLLWFVMIAWHRRKLPKTLRWSAIVVSVAGFFFHTLGFGLRIYIAGRPPVTNMYETVLWVSYGVLIFAFIIYWKQKHKILLAVGYLLAFLGLITADFSPVVMDPSIQPLVPVLNSNLWLLIHVMTITISYAAFALALGLGNVSLLQILRRATRGKKTDEGKQKDRSQNNENTSSILDPTARILVNREN